MSSCKRVFAAFVLLLSLAASAQIINPATGAGGSGTVANCGAAGNAFYPASGTTTNCDTTIVDSTGTLNFTQGSIAASAPWLNHTATWNGAVVFTDFFSNITCTTANALSKALDLQAGSTAVFTVIYVGANCATPEVIVPNGVQGNPGLAFQASNTMGLYSISATILGLTSGATTKFGFDHGNSMMRIGNTTAFAWSSAASTTSTNNADTCLDRSAAGVIRADANTGCSDGLGKLQAQLYTTNTNCANSGGTCTAASSGAVTIAAAATTVTVATTAVTANSQIQLSEDSSLGTRLSVTCNTTLGRTYAVTSRTAATNFVITTSAAPATNPACLNYTIIN